MNRFDRDRFDAMGKEALSRVEELMNSSRINELLHKREEDEKKKNCILWVLAIIGAVAAWQVLHMQCTASLHRIIWKILKTTLTMILTMTSLKMRSRRRKRLRSLNRDYGFRKDRPLWDGPFFGEWRKCLEVWKRGVNIQNYCIPEMISLTVTSGCLYRFRFWVADFHWIAFWGQQLIHATQCSH